MRAKLFYGTPNYVNTLRECREVYKNTYGTHSLIYGYFALIITPQTKEMPELVRFVSSKVDSKRLMVTFYEDWLLKKEDKREAFRHAQLSIRQKFPEPRLWGAFVMVGR